MALIRLVGFAGEQPRILPRFLPPTAAQSAVNVRLDDGGLTPTRVPSIAGAVSNAAHATIYKHGSDWLSFPGVVNIAPGPVATERLYYTGDGAPKMRVGVDTYDLAVPRPTVALTAAPSGIGSGDVYSRVYVYTFVTSLGEESEPSPPSNAVDWQAGKTIDLSGFQSAPAGRLITKQRIYRSQTGQSGTYLYLIAERNAANTNYNDAIAPDAFQEALPSADWNTPVATLAGLVSLPAGMMAGFSGRDLYFCEPYRPHAWPEKYALQTDSPIVALASAGGALVVLTEGQPYWVEGSHPASMQPLKLETNLPCINARGVVDLGYGVAYPSHEGLVLIKAGGAGIVTANLFNRDTWLTFSPATMIAGQLSGRYVAFYDTVDVDENIVAGALHIDVSGDPYLIRSSDRAHAVSYDVASGGLYFKPFNSTSVYQLDAPGAARHEMTWRSKEHVLPYPENFGAIKIDTISSLTGQETEEFEQYRAELIAANNLLIAAGSIGGDINALPVNELVINGDLLHEIPAFPNQFVANVYADKKFVTGITRTNEPVRLPSGFRAQIWEVEIVANVRVEQILIGTTVQDLLQAA